MDKVTRASVRYVEEFVDVMHEALTICLREEWPKEDFEDPGRFIEAIIPRVEELTGERGQVAVWVAYALFSL